MAKKEGKTPVVALCEKGRAGFWIMVHSDDLDKLKNKSGYWQLTPTWE